MDPSVAPNSFSSANDQPNVTQLDFHQSMRHFKTMFPDIDEGEEILINIKI